MPRRARGPVPAGTYHVTFRSAGPIAMYGDDWDRTKFCNLLAKAIRRQGWLCHAFCQVTTHYHLLLDVDENTLQKGMQSLNGPYAQIFNARHGRSGHLRGDRYYAGPIEDEPHYLRAFRYVVRNPVRAGLCHRPSQWPWSSFAGSCGEAMPFPFVNPRKALSYFGTDPAEQVRLLRMFVGDLEDLS